MKTLVSQRTHIIVGIFEIKYSTQVSRVFIVLTVIDERIHFISTNAFYIIR